MKQWALSFYEPTLQAWSCFFKVFHGMPCWILRSHGLITWLQVLNRALLFSVLCCLLLDGLLKKPPASTLYVCLFRPLRSKKEVMVDHLQSRDMPWRYCLNHVKVCGTLLKLQSFGLSISRYDARIRLINEKYFFPMVMWNKVHKPTCAMMLTYCLNFCCVVSILNVTNVVTQMIIRRRRNLTRFRPT